MKIKRPDDLVKVEFLAGDVTKYLNVWVRDYDVEEIEFLDLKSNITKTNLLTLQKIYNIDWIYYLRYPVNNRYGYIVKGIMGPEAHNVTYLRNERANKSSGTTELYFAKGMKLPVKKLILTHQNYPENVEIWTKHISPNTLQAWYQLTRDNAFMITCEVSHIVNNIENRGHPDMEQRAFNYLSSLGRRLSDERLKQLQAILEKIQFERV